MNLVRDIKLVTPISHLFNKYEDAIQIAKYSDELEARERTCELRFSNTTHYHIDFDLNLGLKEKQIEFLNSHVKSRPEIETLTFQLTRDTEEYTLLNGKYFPKGSFIDRKEQLIRSKNSIKKIKEIVGNHRKIGIENNNYYNTGAYEIATSSEFINQVIYETDSHLLLDIAHAKVTSQNKKIDIKEYINKLVKDINCKQIHLCEPGIRDLKGKEEGYDAHLLPTKESIKESLDICRELQIKYLTLEYYQNKDKLIECLKLIKKMINK